MNRRELIAGVLCAPFVHIIPLPRPIDREAYVAALDAAWSRPHRFGVEGSNVISGGAVPPLQGSAASVRRWLEVVAKFHLPHNGACGEGCR